MIEIAFPTIPTSGAGRIISALQSNTTATRTFPDLSTLTKTSGDLLIAIVFAYQTSTGTDAAFSGWTGGFTEFGDRATSTTLAIGMAYKWSTGSETGTFAATQAATITGHAVMIVMAIPGAHASTPPEAGTKTDGTTAAADIAAFNPTGWDVEDTLWIAVGGCGETGTGGSFFGMSATTRHTAPWAADVPTNYSNGYGTGCTTDAIGGIEGAVGFRQLAAASDDPAGFAPDLGNARNSALLVAVRPAADPNATVTPGVVAAVASVPSATPSTGATITATTVSALAAVPAASVVAGGGPQVKDVQTNTTGGTSCSITTTAGESLTGRLVVTFHGSDFYAASGMVAPTGDLTGWQQLALGDLGTNNSHVKAWATTIDSGGAKTVTVAPVTDEECWNVTLVVSNAGDIGDIIAAGGTVLDTVEHTPPSLSAVPDNSLWLGAVLSQTFALVNYTVTGTMVDLGEIDNVGTLNAASDDIATGGTISGREFTGDVAVDCAAVALAVPAPSAGGDDATVTPAAVAGVATVPSATFAAGSTVTPNAVSAIAAIPARTLSTGSTASAAAVAATSTVPVPTAAAGSTVTPAAVAATATIPTPSVSAGGAVTATPTTVTAVANVGLPTLQASSTVTASTVPAAAAVPTASVHIGAVITLATVAGVAAIATPTVTTFGGATVTPATVMALASVPAPEVNPADQGSFVSTTTGPRFTASESAATFASTSAGGDV